jgi:hypothetical protein
MNERSKPIAILAAALIVVYCIGSFLSWLTRHHDNPIFYVAVGTLAMIVVATGVGAYFFIVAHPMGRALADIGLGVVAACVLSAFLAPFARGSFPFSDGAGDFFLRIWLFLGAAILGIIFAALFAMALGRDYRDQALKRYAESKAAKPRRPVRR